MKQLTNLCILSILLCTVFSCKKTDYVKVLHDPALYRQTVKQLNNIVLENNFPPVIASRNYVYANIAAYEVIAAGNPDNYNSLSGQIKHLTKVPVPAKREAIDYQFAALLAFCKVGNAVTFPEGSMNEYVDQLKEKAINAGLPDDMFDASIIYADTVAKHILKWSKGDNYLQTRSASKFTVTEEEGRWIPTPPMYASALEPHWCEIRPMVLDSPGQLVCPAPPKFDVKNKASQFYKNALEVKMLGDSLSLEQKHIADFWDDNPFKMNVVGHVSYATKKFSPGGHWMNIVGIATQKNQSDFNSTVSTYAETSIALFDGFISCWYMKFKTNYLRPETVITRFIDPNWRPYIQTPPFPEYTSGHAVISAAAAEVLTARIGDSIPLRDTSETEFGIPERTFKSFRLAAREAGMSRVFGGIHYINSCKVGSMQGEELGKMIVQKLQLRKTKEKIAFAPTNN
jgi:hypothetical protein